MTKKLNISVEELWEAGLTKKVINDLHPEELLQYKILFYSGVHAMIHVHEVAQKECASKKDYVEFFDRLHSECLALDEWINDQQEEEEKPKKPHLKLVRNNASNVPD